MKGTNGTVGSYESMDANPTDSHSRRETIVCPACGGQMILVDITPRTVGERLTFRCEVCREIVIRNSNEANREGGSSMMPIFDRDAGHVGWVSGDGESIFDAEMNWIGFIDRGDAWQASNGDWVGPVIDGNFYDRTSHPIAWTNTKLRPQGAFKKPLQPLKPLKPLATDAR